MLPIGNRHKIIIKENLPSNILNITKKIAEDLQKKLWCFFNLAIYIRLWVKDLALIPSSIPVLNAVVGTEMISAFALPNEMAIAEFFASRLNW